MLVGTGFVDVDATGELILVWGVEDQNRVFSVIDRDGNELSSLEAGLLANAQFLDDGTIAITDHDRIGVWDANTKEVTWSSVPSGMVDPYMRVVGNRVVVACEPCDQPFGEPNSVLVDPHSGEEFGGRWLGELSIVAASPDGTRFVTGVEKSGFRWQVDLRDAITGKVLGTYPGEEYYGIRYLYWLTPNVIVFDQAIRGTGAESEFYIHTAADFGAKPTRIEPFVEEQTISQRGNTLLITNGEGDVLITQLVEAT